VAGVEFLVAPAEASALPSASVDLVTVAQALHWFNIERFFEEARRVLKDGGLLAYWSYYNCRVNPDVDEIVEAIFADVYDFWPPESELVENRYRDVTMPFREIAAGPFSMTTDWTAGDTLNYIRTWSAVRRYQASRGADPVEHYAEQLRLAWGDGRRTVDWPLVLRVGRK